MANIPVPSYPQSGWPKKEWFKADRPGPANYQQGGNNMYANECGMSGFEELSLVFGGLTASGTYFGKFYPPSTAIQVVTEVSAPLFPYVIVKWFYSANSVEVANNTNLAAELFRFGAVGV